MQIPSASNSAGTLLGTLAGALVASTAPSWPFIITGAALFGTTPIGLAGIAAVGVTALVNYAVSHVAEVNNLNELAKNYWPQIQRTYPSDTPPSTTVSNINKG